MFKSSHAFSSYSVKDINEATRFYKDVLGLEVKEEEMGSLSVTITDDCEVMLYPKENHEPATFTVLNFMVDDIDASVDELTSHGVKFEHYDTEMIHTDEKGIARGDGATIAWFTDPSGNIISIIQEEK